MSRIAPICLVVVTAALMPFVAAATGGTSAELDAFQAALEELAAETKLPGFSAAVVRDGKLVWSHGYGFADVEKKIPARADTPYRLASCSKPFAAVVLMRLVEAGKLDLDAPMRDFEIHPWFEPGGGSWAHYPSRYDDGAITVRHILTHTSKSTPPGDGYEYSGNIFADLTWVIEDVTKRSYPEVVREMILEPLGMTRTLPGQLAPWGQDVARAIATPYDLETGTPVRGTYPGFGLDPDVDVTPWNLDPAYRMPSDTQAARRALLGEGFTPLYSAQTAAGMLSTVEDLARFDIALDGGKLVSADGRTAMFTASRSSNGKVLPYGLGWFVEEGDVKLVWHYGWFPPVISALYLKVPERNLTFILLSNCDLLSAGVSWSTFGVRASPFARLFLAHFVAD